MYCVGESKTMFILSILTKLRGGVEGFVSTIKTLNLD